VAGLNEYYAVTKVDSGSFVVLAAARQPIDGPMMTHTRGRSTFFRLKGQCTYYLYNVLILSNMIIFGILAMFRIICLLIVDGCTNNNNDCFMETYQYY